MPTLDNLATRFAHCVSLFRDPTAKAGQKKEFRALLGLLQDTAVTLRLAQGGGGIEVNGVPCEGEGVAVLVERLDLHGIGEIALPANPPPAQLFELLQALADQPGAVGEGEAGGPAGAGRTGSAPAAARRLATWRAPGWSASAWSSSSSWAGGGFAGRAISPMPWRSRRCTNTARPSPSHGTPFNSMPLPPWASRSVTGVSWSRPSRARNSFF